jgi:hypothetical protein
MKLGATQFGIGAFGQTTLRQPSVFVVLHFFVGFNGFLRFWIDLIFGLKGPTAVAKWIKHFNSKENVEV